jgi:transposase
LLDLTHLALDGSIIKADASNKKTLTGKELEFLSRFVDKELEEWAEKDQVEEELFHESRGFDQLEEANQKKVKKIVKKYVEEYKEKGGFFQQQVKNKLEKAREELKEEKLEKVSVTDPDARFMKNKKKHIEYSYNVQVTVDAKGFILANDVCQDPVDTDQLKPQLCLTQENIKEDLNGRILTVDSGYYQGENLRFLEEKKIDAYIPANDTPLIKPFDKENFRYDPVKDQYFCPENKVLSFFMEALQRKNVKNTGKLVRFYKGQSCIDCNKKHECTKSKKGIRIIKSYPYEVERNRMTEKMKTEAAKDIYKLRARTVEPVIGDLKHNKGINRFLTRGIHTAKTEFSLACTGSNLIRIRNRRTKRKNTQDKTTEKTTHYKTLETTIIITGRPV